MSPRQQQQSKPSMNRVTSSRRVRRAASNRDEDDRGPGKAMRCKNLTCRTTVLTRRHAMATLVDTGGSCMPVQIRIAAAAPPMVSDEAEIAVEATPGTMMTMMAEMTTLLMMIVREAGLEVADNEGDLSM